MKRETEDILRHLRVGKSHIYSAGASIYKQGDPADDIHLILYGRVKVNSNELPRAVVQLYRDEELFGEQAFTHSVRPNNATTIVKSSIMSWTTDEIYEASKQRPQLLIALFQAMTERVNNLEKLVTILLSDDAKSRLVRTLLNISSTDDDGTVRITDMTHDLLGCLIGTTREVVTLFMCDLRRMGLIHYKARNVIILQKEQMETYLKEDAA